MMTKILAIWFIVNIIFVAAWDIVTMLIAPDHTSVSMFIYEWGKRYPALYLIIGVGIGHLIVPLRVTNGAPAVPQ